MVDWQALEGIGGVATAVAVVIALVFGIVQVRHAAQDRRQAVISNVVASFTTPHFLSAMERVLALPDDAPPETIRDDAELRRAFVALDYAIEGVGVLVYERSIELHAVDRWMGGIARVGWQKVRRFAEDERRRAGTASIAEWWQWLVERMEEDPSPGKAEGAHVAFRAWKA